jgi:hypothetical protein
VKRTAQRGLIIIEDKRREAELGISLRPLLVSQTARFEGSINRCLVVTAAHKARSMLGKPIELSDEVSEIVDSFVGTRAQVRLGAGHRSSRLIT